MIRPFKTATFFYVWRHKSVEWRLLCPWSSLVTWTTVWPRSSQARYNFPWTSKFWYRFLDGRYGDQFFKSTQQVEVLQVYRFPRLGIHFIQIPLKPDFLSWFNFKGLSVYDNSHLLCIYELLSNYNHTSLLDWNILLINSKINQAITAAYMYLSTTYAEINGLGHYVGVVFGSTS